jgi:hypothetical protein
MKKAFVNYHLMDWFRRRCFSFSDFGISRSKHFRPVLIRTNRWISFYIFFFDFQIIYLIVIYVGPGYDPRVLFLWSLPLYFIYLFIYDFSSLIWSCWWKLFLVLFTLSASGLSVLFILFYFIIIIFFLWIVVFDLLCSLSLNF